MITCKRGKARTRYMPSRMPARGALAITATPSFTIAPAVAPPTIVSAPIVHRSDLINLFIAKRNYARYLEIVTTSKECFGKVEARVKVRVNEIPSHDASFDLIFI